MSRSYLSLLMNFETITVLSSVTFTKKIPCGNPDTSTNVCFSVTWRDNKACPLMLKMVKNVFLYGVVGVEMEMPVDAGLG